MPMSEIAEDNPSSSMIIHEVEKSPSPMVMDTIKPPLENDSTTSENDSMRDEEGGASSSMTAHGPELPSANGQLTVVADGHEDRNHNKPPSSANNQAAAVADGGEEGNLNPFLLDLQSPSTSPAPSPASSPIIPRDHNINPALDIPPLALAHPPCPIIPRDHNIDPALDIPPLSLAHPPRPTAPRATPAAISPRHSPAPEIPPQSANGCSPPSAPHVPHPSTAAPHPTAPSHSLQPTPPTTVAPNPTTAVGPLKIFLPPRATSSKTQKSSKKRKRDAPGEMSAVGPSQPRKGATPGKTSAVGPKGPSQPSPSEGPSENSETSAEPKKRHHFKSAKALAMEGS